MRIIFLNYGLYASNSGGHIANFAAELAKLGHSVAICAEGDPDAAREVCGELVEYFSHESVDFEPTSLMGGFSPQDVIIHAWTPRDKVVFLTETLMSQGAGHYVVHLEDNEELLTAANLGLKQTELVAATENLGRYNFPLSLSHPTRYKDFIRGSSGATVIVEPLSEFVHPDVPVHILEPGVSVDYFGAELSPEQRSSVRQRYGAAEDDIVCVYHGNMHRANEREIFSLYTANLILQRRGIKFRLIRAGKNFTDGLDLSFDYLRSNVMEVGYLSSEELLRLLQIADLFVQPGASNAFNDYRFPSKIPEFLARGRPVLLPATNIGLRLRDGVDAILLRRGDGEEIADKIETLVSDQARCKDLGAHARRFAEEQLNWSTNAKSLVHFYAQCMQKPNGGILNGQSKKVSRRRFDQFFTDDVLARLRSRYQGYRVPRVAVGTVADHCDSVDHFGPLATHQGDMKDMQRCWVMKAILATAHPGAKLLEIGAGEPVVAGLLARLGYDVTIIDPYDGCGNGPTSFDHYCSEYPDVRFRREYLNELTVIEPEFDVIYSISVLEHVPLDNMANLFEGVRKASVEGAVYIHAVDHVLRGIGSDYHLDMLTHVAADCHIRASDLADALDFAADDPDTYFLSAEAHNRWRGATPYEQFPMRRCISVQFRGD